MQIAIISDTHDNLATLKKALDWINKNDIQEIIHCGDICSASTLKKISNAFNGKIHVVFGNVDTDKSAMGQNVADKVTPNVILHGERGKAEIDKKRIAFIHRPDPARELAATGEYDFVFYGHTHQPWEEKINNCRLVNPGTLSAMFQKATLAVYDTKTDKLELKIVERL